MASRVSCEPDACEVGFIPTSPGCVSLSHAVLSSASRVPRRPFLNQVSWGNQSGFPRLVLQGTGRIKDVTLS